MRCEDYPCCGHTDGLPCDWTYAPEAAASDRVHAFCDHEAGFCEVDEAIDSAFEEDDPYAGTGFDGYEDSWLDGSYEE